MSAGIEPDGVAVPTMTTDAPALTAEQRELVRRLEISWAQAERGEVIPFEDVLRELRLEREAEENADRNNA